MAQADSQRSSTRCPRWRRGRCVDVRCGACGHAVAERASAQSETPAEQAAQRDPGGARSSECRGRRLLRSRVRRSTGSKTISPRSSSRRRSCKRRSTSFDGEVELVALSRYVESGTEGIPLLTDISEPQDQIQAEVYVDILTNTGADTLDQYRRRREGAASRRRTRSLTVKKRSRRNARNSRVSRRWRSTRSSGCVRSKRTGCRTKRSRRRSKLGWPPNAPRLEEQQRLEAEAAARAQPNPGLVVPTTTEPTATTVPDVDAPPTTDEDGNVVTAPETTTPRRCRRRPRSRRTVAVRAEPAVAAPAAVAAATVRARSTPVRDTSTRSSAPCPARHTATPGAHPAPGVDATKAST